MISKTAIKYCRDDISNIENYNKAIADKENIWHCHHRFETDCPLLLMSKEELKERDLYYNRPADELIFLTKKEHHRLHEICRTDFDAWLAFVYYPFYTKQMNKYNPIK